MKYLLIVSLLSLVACASHHGTGTTASTDASSYSNVRETTADELEDSDSGDADSGDADGDGGGDSDSSN